MRTGEGASEQAFIALIFCKGPVFSTLGKLRQEDREFNVSMGYTAKLSQKHKQAKYTKGQVGDFWLCESQNHKKPERVLNECDT